MTGFAIDTQRCWHVTGGFALCGLAVVTVCARSNRSDLVVIDFRRIPACCAMTNFAFRTRSDMTGGFSCCTYPIVTTDARRCDIAMIEIGNRPIGCIVMAGIAIGANCSGHVGRGFADRVTRCKHAVVTTIASCCGGQRMAKTLRLGK